MFKISKLKKWLSCHFWIMKIGCGLCVMALLSALTIAYIKNRDFDVDLVYLWCDGEEPSFKERKDYYLEQQGEVAPLASSPGRFVQVDELKYSLRSVEKYLPWIHHIYIVTDRQVPKWLNTKHPKITIIDHSKIIPQKYIPVFNSSAIEAVLYKIPNLSEHFLYANDDMFVNHPLDKDFFFKDGKVIVRITSGQLNKGGLHKNMLLNSVLLMERDFGKIPLFSEKNLEPHHNIDAYLKSDYTDCAKHFQKEYTETLTHRFRQETSVRRFIVSMWSFMKGNAELKKISREGERIDSLFTKNTNENYLRKLRRYNPGLFCINDTEKSSQADRKRLKQFLKDYFPNKSAFEK